MKYLFLFLLCTCLLSCISGEGALPGIPDDVLPVEKMAVVVEQIHLAEAEVALTANPDTISKDRLSFQKIYEENGITKEQYKNSLDFYTDHPELLNKVYGIVLEDLTRKQVGADPE